MTRIHRRFRAGLLAVLLPLGACDLLDVESPGQIADDDLNSQDAIAGLVVGMSYDLAQSIDSYLQEEAMAAGEVWHGGSYDFADIPRGIILAEDVDGLWGSMHQARWVAEQGVARITTILEEGGRDPGKNAHLARAYLLAGFANRNLGENMCYAVFDGGPQEPFTAHFERAEQQFGEAIRVGQAAGQQDVVTAAYAGRASVRAWNGDWAGAVVDAKMVPTGFQYDAVFSSISPNNDFWYETHSRPEFTVYNTIFADHPDDPRAPWKIIRKADGSVGTGANGSTPQYTQLKYTDTGADIPLAKGTEMLVLRAEAALRTSDIAGAYALMNEARAHYTMAPLTPAGDLAGAWADLHYERGATNWLEGRRLWDLRRWFNETGPAHHDFLQGRAQCFPISEEEMNTNSALRGG